ncbi:adenosylhomocysteinase [Candidatus Bathyarchaeota archaeon]|nr:adenosylhomocysteinase [Candidatus Bathyarchaeota archaeon]
MNPTRYRVKDERLYEEGLKSVGWAEGHMPVLMSVRRDFEERRPLKNLMVGACLHVTKETAVLVRTLTGGGAEVALCGSNPLSTQDDVAAALANEGVQVYAWRGESIEEYYWCLERVAEARPDITLDDGADLVNLIHSRYPGLADRVLAGTEETTSGVVRLRAMAESGALKYPIIAVNDAYSKYLFDNRYGTGQSTIDGILRSTALLLAGKNFVVCGYGWCGRGIAARARGMGSNVIVTEVDPLRALEAAMDGFSVMPIQRAAEIGDIFVTATGDVGVITGREIEKMRDGAILANAGHFNVEVKVEELESMAKSKRTVRPNVKEYTLGDGRRIYLLAEGRLVNLGAAEGHPCEVMMMSFANQALCAEYIAEKGRLLERKVHRVPEEIDRRVAMMALESMGIEIDTLTGEQEKYLKSWKIGT